MIIVDIETSGLSPIKHGMLSIGAVHMETDQKFYMECYLDDSREVDDYSLEINGFTKEQIKDPQKFSDIDVLITFCRWAEVLKDNILCGHNVGHFDILFLEEIWSRIDSGCFGGLKPKFPFSYRTVDLHSLAYKEFGKSMSHPEICIELGLEPEPKPHNALEGAKSEAAAFRLLLNL